MSGSFNELDVPPTSLVSLGCCWYERGFQKRLPLSLSAGSALLWRELPADEETGLPAYEKANGVYGKGL